MADEPPLTARIVQILFDQVAIAMAMGAP